MRRRESPDHDPDSNFDPHPVISGSAAGPLLMLAAAAALLVLAGWLLP
jgi:hypothetical protein